MLLVAGDEWVDAACGVKAPCVCEYGAELSGDFTQEIVEALEGNKEPDYACEKAAKKRLLKQAKDEHHDSDSDSDDDDDDDDDSDDHDDDDDDDDDNYHIDGFKVWIVSLLSVVLLVLILKLVALVMTWPTLRGGSDRWTSGIFSGLGSKTMMHQELEFAPLSAFK
jgi:hypothetical protein